MAGDKTKKFIVILPIFLLGVAGVSASFGLTKLIQKEPQPQLEITTKFYAVNESKIVFGKPAFYRTIIENQEGTAVDYLLKVQLAGEVVYTEEIKLNKSDVFNKTISFIPNVTGNCIRLEFLLYKDNVSYRSRVFQVSPLIDYGLAPDLAISPPLLQNGDMEKNIGWEFNGKEFTGNYSTYEWNPAEHLYQIKASRGVKKGAFGAITQNFSSAKEGFTSLSFEVKSSNTSYYLQALVNDEIVWENSSGADWQRIHVPLVLKKSNKLEIKVSKGNVSKGDGLYTATAKGDRLLFLGETYEKMFSDRVNYLYPVLMDIKNTTLKINETLKLKNGYTVAIKQIDNQSLKLSISKDNRTIRDILSTGNSSIEFCTEISEFKKQKVIQITPGKIYEGEAVLDIIQYGNKKIFMLGSKYGEFQVTNITGDSIIMKNIQPIKIEAGKVVPLMSGKIRIKV